VKIIDGQEAESKAKNKGAVDGVKLFEQAETIKESWTDNKDAGEALESPKIYLNVVHSDRVLPPLTQKRDIADSKNDRTWQIIPIAFTPVVKRRNMNNVECWHFDGHINTCVYDKMRESAERFKSILHYLI